MKQVLFDEGSAQFVLTLIGPDNLVCPACGKVVHADSFGGAALLNDKSRVWHKVLPCVLALSIYISSHENES